MTRHSAAPCDSSMTPDLADQFAGSIRSLRGYARSLTRNADVADDLVQDALAKGWKSRSQFVPGTNFRAWMFTIMRHHFLDDCRRNKDRTLPIEEVSHHAALVSGPAQDVGIEFEEMASAYWQLSSNHREILMLVGAMGLEYEEAAKILRCATGTIRSRLSRARAELQRRIEQGDGRVSRASGHRHQKQPEPTAGQRFLRQLNYA